ncbi:MAG: DUF1330 domain-containing protein [Beijerinckiaceae bacterium]
MAKAYWIARVDVHDDEAYKGYVAANAAAFKKYGAKFLVRGAKPDARLGTARARNVVIEFADLKTAVDCYESAEYQHAIKVRGNSADVDMIIIEGYDGPQPA